MSLAAGTKLGLGLSAARFAYDVFPDGQRFLVNQQMSSKEEPINVLVNWAAGLKKP